MASITQSPFQRIHDAHDTNSGPQGIYGSVQHNRYINMHGETELHILAAEGRYDIIMRLANSRIDVNAKTITGWTPLMYALARNDKWPWQKKEGDAVSTARALIEKGADPRIETAEGLTAFHLLGSYPDMSSRNRALVPGFPPSDRDPEIGSLSRNDSTIADLSRESYADARTLPTEPKLLEERSAAVLARELVQNLSPKEVNRCIHAPARTFRVEEPDPAGGSRFLHSWGSRRVDVTLINWRHPSDYDAEDRAALALALARVNAAGDPNNRSFLLGGPIEPVEGITPLHWAARHGASGVAQVFVEFGGREGGGEGGSRAAKAEDSFGTPLALASHWYRFGHRQHHYETGATIIVAAGRMERRGQQWQHPEQEQLLQQPTMRPPRAYPEDSQPHDPPLPPLPTFDPEDKDDSNWGLTILPSVLRMAGLSDATDDMSRAAQHH